MNLDDLRQWNLDRRKEVKHVYFNDKGRILCLSRGETDDYPDAKHITMTAEQLSVIDETTSVNDVLVEMDAKNKSVYRLVKKTIELQEFRTKDDVLSQIAPYDNSNYDVKINIGKDKIGVTMHTRLIKRLTDNVDLDDGFTVNGKKICHFHFTKKNDPHFHIKTLKVDLVDLVKEKSKFYNVEEDLSKCSIYTKKVFDKYVYTYKEK